MPLLNIRTEMSMPAARRRAFGAVSLAVLSSLSLAACATINSEPKTNGQIAQATGGGVTYFLPLKRMKVTATRTPLDVDKLTEARDAKAKALDAAKAKAGAAKADREYAAKVLDDLPATAAVRGDQEKAVDLAKAKEQVGTEAVKAAEASLAKAAALLAQAQNGSTCSYEVKLELMAAEPDPNLRFVAHLSHNPFRDDTATLKVSSAGLLSSSDVAAADRTGDIIVEAAGAFGALGDGARAFAPQVASTTPLCSDEPHEVIEVFDPLVQAQTHHANQNLASAGFPFQLRVDGNLAAGGPATAEAVSKSVNPSGGGALFYRAAAPLTVVLQRDQVDVDAAVVLVPQAGPIGYIPQNSSAFVKTTDKAEFTDGMLTSWSAERPSEVLEIVRLPVKVATALISVPAQILSLKVDYSSKAKSLAEAQKAQVDAQLALQKLKTCLDVAKATGTPADACVTAAAN